MNTFVARLEEMKLIKLASVHSSSFLTTDPTSHQFFCPELSRYDTLRLVRLVGLLYMLQSRGGVVLGAFHLGLDLINTRLLVVHQVGQVLVYLIYSVHAFVYIAYFFLAFAHDFFADFVLLASDDEFDSVRH